MYTHKITFRYKAVERIIANNHGNQKYSEPYQNDFNTWLKVLGIISNEIYRYRPPLIYLLYLQSLTIEVTAGLGKNYIPKLKYSEKSR